MEGKSYGKISNCTAAPNAAPERTYITGIDGTLMPYRIDVDDEEYAVEVLREKLFITAIAS